MNPYPQFLVRVLLAIHLLAGLTEARAAVFSWSGSGAGPGSGANNAWTTVGNWTNNLGLPVAGDTVLFGLGGSATNIGIAFPSLTSVQSNIGAIVLSGGSTVDRFIGNSSTSADGVLTLSGAGGGLITNSVSGRTLFILSNTAAGTRFMSLLLPNAGTIEAVGNVQILVGVTGAGAIAKTGAGTLILGTNNVMTGVWSNLAGTLQVGTGGAAGNFGAGNLTNNATLIINRNDIATFANIISGSGNVTVNGGIIGLSANNGFLGTLTVNNSATNILLGTSAQTTTTVNNNSVLRVANSGGLGTSGGFNLNPNNAETGRLELTNSVTILSATRTLVMQGRNNTTDAIRSIGGNNIISGPISFTTGGSTYAIDSTSGTLTLVGGVTSTATGGRTLTLQGAATGTVPSAIVNGSATMALTKGGIGTWTLTGTNIYTGVTTISGGLLALSGLGSIANSPSIFVGVDSTFSVGAVTGGYMLAVGQILSGVGEVVGSLRATNGTAVAPGTTSTAGTLQFANNVSFEDGAGLLLDLAGTTTYNSGTNDLLLIGGNLALSGVTRVGFSFLGGAPALGMPYTIARYFGSLSGGVANLIATNCPYTATFSTATPGEVRVTFTGTPASLVWNGSPGGLTSNVWNVAAATNWLNGVALAPFRQGDAVLFDNTSATQTVNLVSSVSPSNTVVNSALNYIIQGVGGIIGGGLTKDGSGTLTISNSANAYAGATLVSGGTVKVGTNAAFGNSSGITVNGTGQIDLNGVSQGTRIFNYTISGTGPDGLGAIKNTVAAVTTSSGVKNLTLAADSTIGSTLAAGGSRLDIVYSGGVLNGGGNKLTKVGVGQLDIRGTTINLTELIVNDGLLYAEDVDNNFGSKLTINPAGSAGVYNNRIQTGEVVLNGGTLSGVGPSLTATGLYTGPVTLNTPTNKVDTAGAYGGANVALSGAVAGPGGLIKSGTGTLNLNGTNTYAGGTTISNGAIQGTTYSVQGNLTNHSALVLNQPFDGTLAAPVLTGTGSLTKRGLGKVTINSALSLTGTITNEAGIIALGADNVLGFGTNDWRGAGGLFPAFESADASTRTITNAISISTDTRLGSAGSGNLVFSGPINNGGAQKMLTVSNALTTFSSGLGNLGVIVKAGPGQLALGGPNNNAGLTISNGLVALLAGGYFSNSPYVTIASGAMLDVSAGLGATFTNAAGRTLLAGNTNGNYFGDDIVGALTNAGTVNVAGSGWPGTLNVSGDILIGGGTLLFDLATSANLGDGVNDYIYTVGNIALSGTITINVNALGGTIPDGDYIVMSSGVAITGTPTFVITGTNGWRQTVTVLYSSGNPDFTIQIYGAVPGPIAWWGTAGNNWDINASINWSNTVSGLLGTYYNGDSVLFDNTSFNTNIVVAGTVAPGPVVVNSSSNHAFSGAGKISGPASYTKTGTGTNLMALANDYTGLTYVNNGILKMGNAAALGATNVPGLNAETVINGGSLDLNGNAIITESFTVQGAGPGGIGAMVNNGAGIVNGGPRARVTLSGDTTFGAPNRWDLQGGATLIGNGFKVTKVGGSEMFLSGLGETALGDIDVQQGFLTWGANSTAGDPTKNYNVAGGAILNFFAHTVPLNKMFTFQNGALIQNGSGTAILAGPVSLVGGSVLFNTVNPVIVSNVISGAGLLVKQNTGVLTLLSNATHTGNTFVSAGTLALGGGFTAPIVVGLITNNATIDLNPSAAYLFTNFMIGSGTFTKSGTNSVQLAGLYGSDQLGDLLTFNLTGGAFDWNGRTEVIRALAGSTGTIVSNSAGGQAMMILANPSGGQTYSGSIAGNTRVVIRDAATKNTTVQIFAGTNTFTGGLLIDNGQLRIASDAQLGAVPASFDAQNITLRNGGLLQNNNTYIYLHPNRGIYLESGDGGIMSGFSRDITVFGVISGPGRFVKVDGGRILLANANTFTGDTVFNNIGGTGTLRLDHPLGLQYSTFDATGIGGNGTLDLNFLDVFLGGLKGSGATIANFTGRLTVGGNNQGTTFGGSLNGSGSLVKIGSGVLDLTGANTVPGGTTISNGALNVAGSLAGGTVTVRPGAALGGFGTVNAHLVADAGSLVSPGASVGTLTISSNATFTGASALFELASLTTIGLGVNDLIQVNGNLTLAGLNTIRFGFLSGAPAAGTYTIIRYTGTLTGGAANLTNAASYGAVFNTSVPGEIRVTFTGAAQNLTWRGDGAGNAWDLNTTSNFFDGAALNVFRDGDSVTFDDTGSNNVPVAITGLIAPADFTVNAAIDYTFASLGELTTPRGLTKLGAGTLTLANTNDSFGPLNILAGTVAIAYDDNLGLVPPLAAPGRVVLNGGTLQASASLTLHPNRGLWVGPSTGNGGGWIETPTGVALTYSGVIANNPGGNGSLTKAGTGMLILSGANTYSGNTIVSRGSLLVRNASALGGAGTLLLGDAGSGTDPITVLLDTATNGASLTVSRDIVVTSSGTGPVTVGSTARFGYPGAEQAVFNGNITLNNRDLILRTGAGDITRFNGLIQGTGNLIITNGSLTGDQRGNGGNRILLEITPKTFIGDVTVLSGGPTNFTVLQIGGGGNTYDFIPDGSSVIVQTNAVLRLYGHEAIDGLSGSGRVRGVVAQYLLTVGSSNATSAFDGVMENDPFDGGSLAFTKIGSGTFTLNSVSPYTGPTIVGGGSLVLGAGAAITNSASLIISNGATLDASALAGGLTLRNNQILSGFGTVAGGLVAVTNTTINPGLVGVAGTLSVGGNLSLSNLSRINVDLATATTAGSGVNDLIDVTGDLDLQGGGPVITVNALSPLAAGTYTLITFTGTKTGAAASSLALVNNTASAMTLGETANSITLTVTTAGRSLVWAAGLGSSVWDITTTANWSNSVTVAYDTFRQGDAVTFDSTYANSNVTLAVTVLPSTVSFTGATNYALSGAGLIGGSASLIVNSTGTNTIGTPNTFSGPVLIQAGVLRANNGAALGNALGATIVSSGATLDVNGQNLGAETVTASGTGVSGQGAIVNNGASQTQPLRFVTLAGDTTFGGVAAGRWDIRQASVALPAALSSGGQPYKLTKIGGNQFSLVGAQVDPALGDIDVLGGIFSIEIGTTGLGDPSRTLAIGTNASLQLWVLQPPLNKSIILSNGASIINGSGENRIIGPVTLVGSNAFNVGGTQLSLSNAIGGTGTLWKNGGTAPLVLAGNNTYSGGTVLQAGTTILTGNNPNSGGYSNAATIQIGNNNNSGSLGGLITNNGTINFQRADNYNFTGGILGQGTINHPSGSGPVTLNGNITNANLNVRSGNGNFLTLGAGTYSLTNVAVGNTPSGWLNILPGAIVGIPNNYFVGDASGGQTGVVMQTGGDVTVTNQFRIGHWPNNVSTYLLSGGSLSLNTVSATTPASGSEVNGGFYIGIDGIGIFTQTGGVLNVPGLVLDNRGASTLPLATNTYELRGGTINLGTWGFLSPNSTYQINLGGGTVGSSMNWTSTLHMSLTGNGGDATFNPGAFTNFLFGSLRGPGGLIKSGAGALILSNAATYTGNTLVSAGTLELRGAGGIASSPLLTVNGTLDTSAKTGGFIVGAGQILRGTGTVLGVAQINGLLSPGTSIGTLTFGTNLTLAGTNLMEIDRGAGPNADLIIASAITNGGALVVTNLGAALQSGDTFNLFDGTLVGVFSSVTLPTLGAGLGWDTTALYTTGVITVMELPTIVTQPVNVNSECGVGTATFTVVAGGTAPFGYQWRSNGVAVGANAASFGVVAPTLAASGSTFDVVVTNNAGSITSSVATLTVVDTTAPVVGVSNITRFLVGNTVAITASEVFNASASSDSCSGVVTLIDATPLSFTCPGVYAVTVRAHDGNLNTNTALATVTIVDPAATNLMAFEPFRCYTEGTLGGQNYAGTGFDSGSWTVASGNGLVTNTASLAYTSSYHALATEGGRAFTPAAGHNTVRANMDTNTGGTFGAYVDGGRIGGPNASGTLYFSFLARNASGSLDGTDDYAAFQLYDDGSEVLGIGNNWNAWAYSLFGLSGDVDLTNNAGGFLSMDASAHLFVARIDYVSGGDDTVTVWMDPDIAASEAGQGNLYRRTFTGNARFNRIALRSGSNNNDNSWDFDEIRFGTNWSNVTPAGVAITVQPANVAQQCGGSTSVSVTANGLVALEYQWYRNASAILAATNASLNISPVTTNTAGSYTVVVNNRYGAVTSAVATVTVTNTPVLISPAGPLLVGVENNECGTMVLAGGSSYRWELNDATGGAGTGWDLLNVTGDINVEATSGNPFTVNLWSLNGVTPGVAANWINDTTNLFTIASASGAVNSFVANKFTLDDANFANDLAGGGFSIEEGSLKLRFLPNHAPIATSLTNNRAPNLTWKIRISDLLAAATSDPDGDARGLTVVGTSTNGVTVTTNATHILYTNPNNVEDEFTYTVRDFGPAYRAGDTVRTATGKLRLTLNAPTGTNGNAVNISFTNSVVGMRFAGIPGYTYDLQRATNLTPPVAWSTLHTTNCPPLGLFDFIDLTPPVGAAYYRTAQPWTP